MTKYAKQTSVPIEKTKGEIERDLKKYGADQFGYMTSDTESTIGFIAHGRMVKFTLPMPDRAAERFTRRRGRGGLIDRKTSEGDALWAQEKRARWRALALVIKAKLEAVESGITTFETEFLAHIVTSNGQTVGQRIIPQLGHGQKAPASLMLGSG